MDRPDLELLRGAIDDKDGRMDTLIPRKALLELVKFQTPAKL